MKITLDKAPRLEPLHPAQVAAWRAMSFDQKMQLSRSLLRTAQALTAARIRSEHPDWNEAAVNAAVARHFLHAHT